MKLSCYTLCLVGLWLAALALQAPAAQAVVIWESETWIRPTELVPGQSGHVDIRLANIGDEASTPSPTTIVEVELPDGVARPSGSVLSFGPWTCFGRTTVTCSMSGESFEPYTTTYRPEAFAPFIASFEIAVEEGLSGPLVATTTVSGGGASSEAIKTHEIEVSESMLGFGFAPGSVEAGMFDEAGEDFTQAGGHGHEAVADFTMNLSGEPYDPGPVVAGGRPRDFSVELPAGFTGNPTATPRCPQAAWGDYEIGCPPETQIGVALSFTPVITQTQMAAVYNMEPPADRPAQFAFMSPAGKVAINPEIDANGTISLVVRRLSEAGDLWRSRVQIWGNPAAQVHDIERCKFPNAVAWECVGYEQNGAGHLSSPGLYTPHESEAPVRPLLTNPTRCGGPPPKTTFRAGSWNDPVADQADPEDPAWKTATVAHPPVTGCDQLEFEPALQAHPTTNRADSPTGLDVHLEIPQDGDPEDLATARLKDAVVTLPEGLTLNPSGANGLRACTSSQIGLESSPGNYPGSFNDREPRCPAASKVANATVQSPLLEAPLSGEVFLAAQGDNPFGSNYALYIVIRGPGVLLKIAGEVEPDPSSGRITSTFPQNPQLPFSDLELKFFGGASAPLVTPPSCGSYRTTSELTPWSAPHSGPPATPSDTYEINRGPGEGACARSESRMENDPDFSAGATVPIARQHSPFIVNLRREDGTQRFSEVEISPPPGLTAKLAGTPYCSDGALERAGGRSGTAERDNPACPAASEIGNVWAAAGAGPRPFWAGGKVYLSGPYKGAPLSMAIVTPAVAGPFDLGTIVVRTALHVDPRTTEITAKSDPIPEILEGIPLDVRRASIRLDKPNFTLNPTSCDPMQVSGSLTSTLDQSVGLSDRFQVGECRRLGFSPRFGMRILNPGRRSTLRSFNPAMRFTVAPPPGQANISRAAVTLPSGIILDQDHLDTICTRDQFAADNCPQGSVVGYARAWSPLLDEPVQGKVLLRSSDNLLPDLAADLRGQVDVLLQGEVTSAKGGRMRNIFHVVPDVPVTRFQLTMFGGQNRGILVNSQDLCRMRERGVANFSAHNGRRHLIQPAVRLRFQGCRKVVRIQARQFQIRRKTVVRAFKQGRISRVQAKRLLQRLKSNRTTPAQARRAVRR